MRKAACQFMASVETQCLGFWQRPTSFATDCTQRTDLLSEEH